MRLLRILAQLYMRSHKSFGTPNQHGTCGFCHSPLHSPQQCPPPHSPSRRPASCCAASGAPWRAAAPPSSPRRCLKRGLRAKCLRKKEWLRLWPDQEPQGFLAGSTSLSQHTRRGKGNVTDRYSKTVMHMMVSTFRDVPTCPALRILGLSMAGVGPSLAFHSRGLDPQNPICLRFRIL